MGGGVRGLSDRTLMIPFGLMWGLSDRPHTPSVGTKVKEYLGISWEYFHHEKDNVRFTGDSACSEPGSHGGLR